MVLLEKLGYGCELDNYDFGPSQEHVEVTQNVTKKTDCHQRCIKENCITYSWNSETYNCSISRSQDQQSVYFCEKPNTTVIRSSILCTKQVLLAGLKK